jgi:hypothetical protein
VNSLPPTLVPRIDPLVAEIQAAVNDLHDGRVTRARRRLEGLWEQVEQTANSSHRCAVAHWLADTQDDPSQELAWDERALLEAETLPGRQVPFAGTAATIATMYPRLHLDVATACWRMRDACGALEHLAKARAGLADLPDTPGRLGIRRDIARLEAELDDRQPFLGDEPWISLSWDDWESFWSDEDPQP